MLWEDSPLHHPLTTADVAALPRALRPLARLLHATPLRFLARALAGWAACWDGLDLRRHPPAARRWVALSWALPAAFAALAWPALLAAGGVERFVGWWLAPWLVFQTWQGLVAVAQSTAPHIPFVEEVRRVVCRRASSPAACRANCNLPTRPPPPRSVHPFLSGTSIVWNKQRTPPNPTQPKNNTGPRVRPRPGRRQRHRHLDAAVALARGARRRRQPDAAAHALDQHPLVSKHMRASGGERWQRSLGEGERPVCACTDARQCPLPHAPHENNTNATPSTQNHSTRAHNPIQSVINNSYNLRGAQDELEARLGRYLTAAPLLSPRLLLNLSTRWLAYDARARRYVAFDAAEAAAEAAAAGAEAPAAGAEGGGGADGAAAAPAAAA